MKLVNPNEKERKLLSGIGKAFFIWVPGYVPEPEERGIWDEYWPVVNPSGFLMGIMPVTGLNQIEATPDEKHGVVWTTAINDYRYRKDGAPYYSGYIERKVVEIGKIYYADGYTPVRVLGLNKNGKRAYVQYLETNTEWSANKRYIMVKCLRETRRSITKIPGREVPKPGETWWVCGRIPVTVLAVRKKILVLCANGKKRYLRYQSLWKSERGMKNNNRIA